jgi:hypothetical protein
MVISRAHETTPFSYPLTIRANDVCSGLFTEQLACGFLLPFLWGSIIAEEKKEREGKVSRLFCDGLSGRVVVGRFA